MKLTEMLGQYEELLDKKDQLAKDTKDNNAAIDKLKAEIAEMMIDEDIPSQGYGDYIYSLQPEECSNRPGTPGDKARSAGRQNHARLIRRSQQLHHTGGRLSGGTVRGRRSGSGS